MRKLSKQQITQRDDFVSRLQTLATEIEGWRQEIVGEMEEYYDNKSENWQESDKGTEYSDWKEAFEALSLDDLTDLSDELENLAEELAG